MSSFFSRKKPALFAIAEKEFKEILRNPVVFLLSFGVPVVFFFILGFGINLDVTNIPIAVVDFDGTKLSRTFADTIFNNRYFTLVGYMSRERAERLLRTNRLRAVVVIPKGFERRLLQRRASEIQILVDGAYPYRAEVVRGYLKALVERFNEQLARKTLNRLGIKRETLPVELRVRSFYNQAMESRLSLIPGLFVIILLINTAILASLSIAREKDYGTIINIYTSPVNKISFVLGKILPYWLVGMANFFVLFALAVFVYGLGFTGSFLAFVFGSSLYVLCACLIGALISSFTKTMIAAQFVAMVVTVIPSFLYSGYLVPVSSLGKSGKVEAALFPAKYYMQIARGCFLKGLGFRDLLPQFASLSAFCLVLFAACIFLFKKREG